MRFQHHQSSQLSLRAAHNIRCCRPSFLSAETPFEEANYSWSRLLTERPIRVFRLRKMLRSKSLVPFVDARKTTLDGKKNKPASVVDRRNQNTTFPFVPRLASCNEHEKAWFKILQNTYSGHCIVIEWWSLNLLQRRWNAQVFLSARHTNLNNLWEFAVRILCVTKDAYTSAKRYYLIT